MVMLVVWVTGMIMMVVISDGDNGDWGDGDEGGDDCGVSDAQDHGHDDNGDHHL